MCVVIGVAEVIAVVIVAVVIKAAVASAWEIIRGGQSLVVVAVWCPPSASHGARSPVIMFSVCSLWETVGAGC